MVNVRLGSDFEAGKRSLVGGNGDASDPNGCRGGTVHGNPDPLRVASENARHGRAGS